MLQEFQQGSPNTLNSKVVSRIDEISRFNVKYLEFDDFSMAADYLMDKIEFGN
jgi:hypothetical protein